MSPLTPDLAEDFTRYVSAPTRVLEAVGSVEWGELNRPGDSGWSARDVLIHLADVELSDAHAIREILTGDPLESPSPRWDERWKTRLRYVWRDPELAIERFRILRFSNAEILERADNAIWSRSLGGNAAARDLLEHALKHVDEHVEQIRALLHR
ncbi:MAG TPA: hypothetical protein QGF35_05555 [Dehalococcoidia bacterium]|nr:hypothetical protein [Dehalococcoidia bacterium]